MALVNPVWFPSRSLWFKVDHLALVLLNLLTLKEKEYLKSFEITYFKKRRDKMKKYLILRPNMLYSVTYYLHMSYTHLLRRRLHEGEICFYDMCIYLPSSNEVICHRQKGRECWHKVSWVPIISSDNDKHPFWLCLLTILIQIFIQSINIYDANGQKSQTNMVNTLKLKMNCFVTVFNLFVMLIEIGPEYTIKLISSSDQNHIVNLIMA